MPLKATRKAARSAAHRPNWTPVSLLDPISPPMQQRPLHRRHTIPAWPAGAWRYGTLTQSDRKSSAPRACFSYASSLLGDLHHSARTTTSKTSQARSPAAAHRQHSSTTAPLWFRGQPVAFRLRNLASKMWGQVQGALLTYSVDYLRAVHTDCSSLPTDRPLLPLLLHPSEQLTAQLS